MNINLSQGELIVFILTTSKALFPGVIIQWTWGHCSHAGVIPFYAAQAAFFRVHSTPPLPTSCIATCSLQVARTVHPISHRLFFLSIIKLLRRCFLTFLIQYHINQSQPYILAQKIAQFTQPYADDCGPGLSFLCAMPCCTHMVRGKTAAKRCTLSIEKRAP